MHKANCLKHRKPIDMYCVNHYKPLCESCLAENQYMLGMGNAPCGGEMGRHLNGNSISQCNLKLTEQAIKETITQMH